MVQIKVDDGSMCQAMAENTVHDANMDIVDPAEPGWVRCRAMVSGRPDCDKGSLRSLGSEDGVDSVAYAAQGALKGVQGFFAEVQIALVELSRGFCVRTSIDIRPLELSTAIFARVFRVDGQLRLGCVAHHLELLHPFRPMNVRHCLRGQRQPSSRVLNSKWYRG